MILQNNKLPPGLVIIRRGEGRTFIDSRPLLAIAWGGYMEKDFTPNLSLVSLAVADDQLSKGQLPTAFNKFYPEYAAKLRKLVLFNCGPRDLGKSMVKITIVGLMKRLRDFGKRKISLC
jgi:hypothetical protein